MERIHGGTTCSMLYKEQVVIFSFRVSAVALYFIFVASHSSTSSTLNWHFKAFISDEY